MRWAAALRRLAQVADADRGAAHRSQRELVQVNDVVRAILPLARAAADRQEARVQTSLEPGLPRVMADRARLAEALTLLADQAASTTAPDRPLVVATTREQGGAGVTITIGPNVSPDTSPDAMAPSPGAPGTPSGEDAAGGGHARHVGGAILADRLVAAQGGSTSRGPNGVTVRLGGSAQV